MTAKESSRSDRGFNSPESEEIMSKTIVKEGDAFSVFEDSKQTANPIPKKLNEAGIKIDAGFGELRKQLVEMMEEALRWKSELELLQQLRNFGAISTDEFNERIATLLPNDHQGQSASAAASEALKEAKTCVSRVSATLKDLDRIRADLIRDPHEEECHGLQPCSEF